MASFLAEIFSYWSGNSTLTGAIPFSQVFMGMVPEGTAFPYAVIVPISNVPSYVTCAPAYRAFTFQISIFDVNLANAEALAATVNGKFERATISANTMQCYLNNGPLAFADGDTAKKVYHVLLEYELLENAG